MSGSFALKVSLAPSVKTIHAAMKELDGDLGDWKSVWRQMIPICAAETSRNITSKGSNLGVNWPALSQATLRKKSRSGERAALVASGRLLRIMGSNKGKRSITKRKMAFGTPGSDRYMYVQHFGSKKRRIPARNYLGITPRIEKSAEKLMQRHANAVLRATARKFV